MREENRCLIQCLMLPPLNPFAAASDPFKALSLFFLLGLLAGALLGLHARS
jgi:hypothetical protein